MSDKKTTSTENQMQSEVVNTTMVVKGINFFSCVRELKFYDAKTKTRLTRERIAYVVKFIFDKPFTMFHLDEDTDTFVEVKSKEYSMPLGVFRGLIGDMSDELAVISMSDIDTLLRGQQVVAARRAPDLASAQKEEVAPSDATESDDEDTVEPENGKVTEEMLNRAKNFSKKFEKFWATKFAAAKVTLSSQRHFEGEEIDGVALDRDQWFNDVTAITLRKKVVDHLNEIADVIDLGI